MFAIRFIELRKILMPRKKSTEKREARERRVIRQAEAEWEANKADTESYLEKPSSELSEKERVAVEYFKKNPFESVFPKMDHVKSRRHDWDIAAEPEVSGKYRDEGLLRSKYQQLFVVGSRALEPGKWQELNEMLPLAKKIFVDWEIGLETFFNFRFGRLAVAYRHLAEQVPAIIEGMVKKPNSEHYNVQFRIRRPNWIDHSFLWGSLRAVLYLAYLNRRSEKAGKEYELFLSSAEAAVREHLLVSRKSGRASPKRTKAENALADETAAAIVSSVISETSRAAESCRSAISRNIDRDGRPEVDTFIELMVRLIAWADRNEFTRDWLIRYALWYLFVASRKNGKDAMSAPVPAFQERSLETQPFDFQFDQWFPGVEEKKSYEKRITDEFKAHLDDFFRRHGRSLKLDQSRRDSVKAVTKGIDPNPEWIKWLIAWNKGGTYEAIAGFAGKNSPETIRSAIKQLEQYDLPVRTATRGGKRKNNLSYKRINAILEAKIDPQ